MMRNEFLKTFRNLEDDEMIIFALKSGEMHAIDSEDGIDATHDVLTLMIDCGNDGNQILFVNPNEIIDIKVIHKIHFMMIMEMYLRG